jgi:2,3-diphosphopglycerate-independent phosphoglycerate mutase
MGSPKQLKTRVAFVLIDGVGDVSLPRFGLKTPLQAAKLPNLDAIASAGVNGLMDPVEVGLGCGSDTAHLSLLGYDPRVYYRGRGAFESMGAGLAMSPGDIAFKVSINFCLQFHIIFHWENYILKGCNKLNPIVSKVTN